MVQHHTASKSQKTIWKPITEERFIAAVTDVFHASKQTAGSPKVYEGNPQSRLLGEYSLNFDVEYQLAQDLAFIAAFEEQTETVSAVTVSERIGGKGISCTVASNAGVRPIAQKYFRDITDVLEKCAQRDLQSALCAQQLFDLVVEFDQARIISRLKCDLWVPPKTFGSRPPPLHTSLQQTFKIILNSNPSRRNDLEAIAARINHIAGLVAKADSEGGTAVKKNLKSIVESAGMLTGGRLSLESFLETEGIKTAAANLKAIKAFDKLANYWHLCQRLVGIASSKRYRSFLTSIHLEFLAPFEKHKVNGNYRYVHAEVQVVTFHRLRKTRPRPRAIGTSKAACYLCDLFLSQHPQYRYSATHGMLYEFWTIPDVSGYTSEDRVQLQSVIAFMYQTLNIRAQSHSRGLIFPMQSGIYQPPYFPSATATTVCSSLPSQINQSSTKHLSGPAIEVNTVFAGRKDPCTSWRGSDSNRSACTVTVTAYSQENDHRRVQLNADNDLPEISVSRSTSTHHKARRVKSYENTQSPMHEGSQNVEVTPRLSAKKERDQQESPKAKIRNKEKSGRTPQRRRHGTHKSPRYKSQRHPGRTGLYRSARMKKRSGAKRHSKNYKVRRRKPRGKKIDRQSGRRHYIRSQNRPSFWQILKEATVNILASFCGIISFSYRD